MFLVLNNDRQKINFLKPALPMIKENTVTQEKFDALLGWLDQNREAAGQKYEKIRGRLIRIFIGRGCFEAEELADETINRVALKLPQVFENYIGEPARYFYGVADKIHLEWLRKQTKLKKVQLTDQDNYSEPKAEAENEYECLENCLKLLPLVQRELIVGYYKEEKGAKILHRKELAKKMGISTSVLQIKTCRIRSGLQKCIRNCIAEKMR